MSLIKPRTRGKQMVQHRTRLDRENNETLHAYAAFIGETDPTGDERAFALSRQARLIPIVATQSVSSLRSALGSDEAWRTLMQCFRTKLFLATSDEFTARTAAELCGRADRLKARYSLTEGGQDAHISLLTGSATAARHSLSASKTYMLESDYVFQPRIFTELQHAQAIALPYDGRAMACACRSEEHTSELQSRQSRMPSSA